MPILNQSQRLFTPELIDRISAVLRENPETTATAIQRFLPIILDAVRKKLTGLDGEKWYDDTLLDFSNQILQTPEALLAPSRIQMVAEAGLDLLASVVDEQALTHIFGTVSLASGLRTPSCKTLLGIITPIEFALLNRESQSDGNRCQSLLNILTADSESVRAALPAGTPRAYAKDNHSIAKQRNPDADDGPAHWNSTQSQSRAPNLRWAKLAAVVVVGLIGLLAWYHLVRTDGFDSSGTDHPESRVTCAMQAT